MSCHVIILPHEGTLQCMYVHGVILTLPCLVPDPVHRLPCNLFANSVVVNDIWWPKKKGDNAHFRGHFICHLHTIHYIGSLFLLLPEQIVKVSWKPSEDADRSAIEYIVNTTTTGMDFINSTFVKHPITLVPISGLMQYCSGTVLVWAKNPGAMSKPVVLRFRMVSIVTNGRYTYICISNGRYCTYLKQLWQFSRCIKFYGVLWMHTICFTERDNDNYVMLILFCSDWSGSQLGWWQFHFIEGESTRRRHVQNQLLGSEQE